MRVLLNRFALLQMNQKDGIVSGMLALDVDALMTAGQWRDRWSVNAAELIEDRNLLLTRRGKGDDAMGVGRQGEIEGMLVTDR